MLNRWRPQERRKTHDKSDQKTASITSIHRHQTPPRSRNKQAKCVHAYGPLRPNVTSSVKPEVHNISQHRQGRSEPRSLGISAKNFVMIGPAVPEICSRTDIQTDRHTHSRVDHNTPHPYRGGVTRWLSCGTLTLWHQNTLAVSLQVVACWVLCNQIIWC